MKLIIDNYDNLGAQDYSSFLEDREYISIHRRLNFPVEMKATLASSVPQFVVPAAGARVQLIRKDGRKLFTGYVVDPPDYEYLGWTATGPAYRYRLSAVSDEFLLDRKAVPVNAPTVGWSAGAALRLLTEETFPGEFDTSGIEDVAALAAWEVDPQKSWSQHAHEIALRARAAYRAENGAIIFTAIPSGVHAIIEASSTFSPADLKLQCLNRVINDITIVGKVEPQSYVKDWFCGDGLSLWFDLSQVPFTRSNRVLLDEEFKGTALDPVRWTVKGSDNTVSVGGGKLQVQCSGADGSTVVQFSDNIEFGGALILQHGQFSLTAPSNGVAGGLYGGEVAIPNCVAGFRITPQGGNSVIQALINGSAVGPVITTVAGHRYAMTTRFYASEIYRRNELFHSSTHGNGTGWGGRDHRRRRSHGVGSRRH